MQQAGDFSSYYSQPHHYPSPMPNPSSNPSDYPPNPIQPPAFASAPPFSPYSDLPPPFSTSSSSAAYQPPSAPSYAQSPTQSTQFTQFQSPYNLPSYPPEQQQQPSFTFPHLQPQPSSLSYYSSYDPQQPAASYVPPPNPGSNSNLNSTPSQNPSFGSPYPPYENLYESSDRYGTAVAGGASYGSGFNREYYDKKPDGAVRYDWGGSQDDGLNEGAYRYDGGKVEPYGARGTGSARSSSGTSSFAAFDDYGRSTSFSSSGNDKMGSVAAKIVRAVPKMDNQQDVKNGVQKFRVKLLAESGGQSTMDVLCQVGLDGIRMLDPSTSRMLRIYPLETVTRWEVADPSIYTFWSKSSVDIEPRRIRLQSNSYTTSTILDTVTAATVQLKEMGGRESLAQTKSSSDAGKQSDQSAERKKAFDWMNLIKPGNEEKEHWVPDEAVTKCTSCGADFNAFVRKHHCRNCGDIFCDKCTHGRVALTAEENAQPVRVCDRCLAEVTQRLSNAKETASKPAVLHSHEDLARKLQEEMEKNRKPSTSSSSSDGSGRRMREVACPICTVHLQVQVPSSGSETIECGVCQHPFLVSAN